MTRARSWVASMVHSWRFQRCMIIRCQLWDSSAAWSRSSSLAITHGLGQQPVGLQAVAAADEHCGHQGELVQLVHDLCQVFGQAILLVDRRVVALQVDVGPQAGYRRGALVAHTAVGPYLEGF